jgi:4-nitrophenyl phosphatase
MNNHSPSIQALILDMDGVLWRGEEPIGDLPAIFATIERRGWQVTLATNNATLSADQYVEKIARLGVRLNRRQIVNSALATARYLQRLHPDGGRVYTVGENGLSITLAEAGFTAVSLNAIDLHPERENILAVIVAMDRQVTYEKLTVATRLVRAGAPLLATNPDRTFPTPQGLVPGAGAILAAVEAASGESALIIGKPSPEMYRVALETMGVAPENALVVGDRLETDIAGGQQLGCQTALVLSGVTTPQAADRWRPPPGWISPDLGSLLNTIA